MGSTELPSFLLLRRGGVTGLTYRSSSVVTLFPQSRGTSILVNADVDVDVEDDEDAVKDVDVTRPLPSLVSS